jgi:CBS domain-containing protein
MWWPAIGGLIIGIGGLFEPRALGVGYDVIGILLSGHATQGLIIGILVVKTLIWSLSLGSGTSGGVLAPVFMIGAALGSLLAYVLPPIAPGFWALMCLAAVVGGVMRSPLTGVVFAMELTHQWDAVMPLTVASTVAFLLSVLILKRSVLTEKVVRKGTHLTREYSIDPLEVFLVGEIMPQSFLCFRPDATLEDAVKEASGSWSGSGKRKLARSQRLYPILDGEDHLVGLLTQHQLMGAASRSASQPHVLLAELMVREPIVGYSDMTLRELANLMAQNQVSSVPIVDRDDARNVLSVMSVDHVLEARLRDVNEEHKYERVLDLMQIRAISGGRVLVRNQSHAPRDEV